MKPVSSIITVPSMSAFLDQIIVTTRRKVSDARATADIRSLEELADRHVPRGFRRTLDEKSRSGIAVIAELKKASPSKGLIRADFWRPNWRRNWKQRVRLHSQS